MAASTLVALEEYLNAGYEPDFPRCLPNWTRSNVLSYIPAEPRIVEVRGRSEN
jgi:hypothetical protein